MVANAADFSTEQAVSPGRDSNPRPAAYKAAALPLSYPGEKAPGFRDQVSRPPKPWFFSRTLFYQEALHTGLQVEIAQRLSKT